MEKRNARQRDRPGGWVKRFLRAWLADLLLIGGAAAVTAGAALIYPPAGWICGGVLSIAGGILAARGEEGGSQP